ncbi:MAG: hypothetical protein KBG82_07270 [Spirochaetes bacterium]|nr:hypothetical protein [Spirochaetota bacterium]NLJ04313.1 hypothetical protein [Exilispira sp.]MBP8991761.1 hypothetical protein [Spirochaetota bacterium]HNV43837.1 hypothetical protein [Exilispira sp.]HOV45888.1 hypothetical protein [Exilispira sp.]
MQKNKIPAHYVSPSSYKSCKTYHWLLQMDASLNSTLLKSRINEVSFNFTILL